MTICALYEFPEDRDRISLGLLSAPAVAGHRGAQPPSGTKAAFAKYRLARRTLLRGPTLAASITLSALRTEIITGLRAGLRVRRVLESDEGIGIAPAIPAGTTTAPLADATETHATS